MPQYRLYCLNDHGGFATSREIEARSDADALALARRTEARRRLRALEPQSSGREASAWEVKPFEAGSPLVENLLALSTHLNRLAVSKPGCVPNRRSGTSLNGSSVCVPATAPARSAAETQAIVVEGTNPRRRANNNLDNVLPPIFDGQIGRFEVLSRFNQGVRPEDAPQSLTWWDLAFLKALSGTRSDVIADVQRHEIRDKMLREMAKVPEQ
jgi:hypothetical protein